MGAGLTSKLLSIDLRFSIVYPCSFAATAAWCRADAFSFDKLAIERLDSTILDKIWRLFCPMMIDSTRDLLSAVVSWELRGLGVFGLT